MATSTVPTVSIANLTASIVIGTHTKKQTTLYVVVLSGRVSKDDFLTLAKLSHTFKGSFQPNSRFTNNVTPDGFNFNTPDEAQQFITAMSTAATVPAAPKAKKGKKTPALAAAQTVAIPAAAIAPPAAGRRDDRMYVHDNGTIRLATATEVLAALKALLPTM